MEIVFREDQLFREKWYWKLMIAFFGIIILFTVYGVHQQLFFGITFGNNPFSDSELVIAGPLIVGLLTGLLWLMYAMRLTILVREDGMYVRYFPFHITFRKLTPKKWTSITYNPLRSYGGWGIRFGRQGKAYNVSGNRGVLLELEKGKLMLGSQKPDELVAALDRRRGKKKHS